jgi:hypothetical protein
MTGQRTGRRILRPTWLAGCLAVTAVLAAVPFAGSAHAEEGLVPGTPCAVGTVACVALGENGFGAKAWLIRNGEVVKGPVVGTSGGPGKDTPTGSFHVLSKDLHHISSETQNAAGEGSEMPYSVFFTSSGVAFHGGGDPASRTAGCIRLPNTYASYFFNNLQLGDTVQVVGSGASWDDDADDDGSLLGGL